MRRDEFLKTERVCEVHIATTLTRRHTQAPTSGTFCMGSKAIYGEEYFFPCSGGLARKSHTEDARADETNHDGQNKCETAKT